MIEQITDLLTQIGIILGSLASIYGIYYKIKQFASSYKEKHHGIKMVSNHFYFKRMLYYLSGHIANLEFTNEDLPRIYASKVFIYDKIETFYTMMYKLAKELEQTGDLKSIGGIDNILNVIIDGVHVYEAKASKNGVPKIFIERFAQFHSNQVESVSISINSILNNNLYDSIEERFSAILDILLGAFTMIMPHINETLSSLNGKLSKALTEMSEESLIHLKAYSRRRLFN